MWRRVCNGTDMAIAHSREIQQVLKLAGYDKPIKVQTEIGVDENVFKPNAQARAQLRREYNLKGFVIGFAGRLTQVKGLQDLFAALSELKKEWSALLVGDGELRSTLAAQAQAAGWNVHITGQVDSGEMPDYLTAMDCLVLPSRTAPDWKEQFGLVLAQAMACRVPVIGSSSGAIPEVIDEAGLVFPEGDVAALRDCLAKLIDAPALHGELAEKGRQRVLARYSATALADETFELFRNLCET